jgi:hypothetical protein
MIGLLWTVGCPKAVPEHLRLDPEPTDAAPAAPIVDLASALAAMVGRDPLARSPFLPDANALDEIAPGGDGLAAFVREVHTVDGGSGEVARELQGLEDQWPGTAVVPLARGYRLRIVETEVATGRDDEASQAELVGLLTPLTPGSPNAGLARLPLAWLGDQPVDVYAERWVLESWLGSPGIPLDVLAGPLAAPQYDDLRGSPVGKLILARVQGQRADDAAAMADLRRATSLAVVRAAADRDAEQDAWSARKKALADELGDPDPIAKLLERAADGLTGAAGSDRATGGALLAIAALRWVDRCQGCGGLDRVEVMGEAGRWDPEIAALAAAWQAVALKESVDAVEVGRDTILFPDDAVDLVDALIGTGAGPIEADVLRKGRADPQVWLSLSRAVGDDGSTDWDGARPALVRHLRQVVDAAIPGATEPETRSALETIARRAVP